MWTNNYCESTRFCSCFWLLFLLYFFPKSKEIAYVSHIFYSLIISLPNVICQWTAPYVSHRGGIFRTFSSNVALTTVYLPNHPLSPNHLFIYTEFLIMKLLTTNWCWKVKQLMWYFYVSGFILLPLNYWLIACTRF